MPLDRTRPPAFQAIHEVRLPAVEFHQLDNAIPLHIVSAAGQPVLRLECVFDAGNWYEQVPGSAFFAVKMLAEGTPTRTSAQISEYLDSYGAFLELNAGPDRASLVVYCLTKFLPNILPLMCEMLSEPTFPQKELDDLRNITLQNLRVNYEKNAYLAGVLFREKLFGLEHPYGRSQRPEAMEAVTQEDVVHFFERTIHNRSFRLILAGQITQTEIVLINQSLGQLTIQPGEALARVPVLPNIDNLPVLAEKPDSVQSSIRVGRRLFTRSHPDFFNMLVTNEVLGGYFGSRLMKNIREEKGFTYGISSNMPSYRWDGYFLIGTDVKKENTRQTLDEVSKEIHTLQTELVPADELETVQNFMAGEFVGSLNTSFEIADRYKVILLNDDIPADFLTNYIQHIRAVTPADIMEMANRYLMPETLNEVIVGGV